MTGWTSKKGLWERLWASDPCADIGKHQEEGNAVRILALGVVSVSARAAVISCTTMSHHREKAGVQRCC